MLTTQEKIDYIAEHLPVNERQVIFCGTDVIGMNVYVFDDNGRRNVYTVYFKKQVYGLGITWKHFKHIGEFVDVVKHRMQEILDARLHPGPGITVKGEVIDYGNQRCGVKVIEITDMSTQACIDHIGRKLATAEANAAPAAVLVILKQLQKELIQYL